MIETAKKVLGIINDNGFKAYIVGGFVRDYLLVIESNDIDITTDATPKELKEIFEDAIIPSVSYGAITIIRKNIRFEITTFRKEIKYIDNRKPIEIEYIDDLYQDLERRDFTINSICMDKDGEIIDFLGGKDDIKKGIIRTIGDSDVKFSQDSLRILRAIRFATSLNFTLSGDVEKSVVKYKHLLKNLSYNRKREELDKIFVNSNAKEGINLLLKFGLDKELELDNLCLVNYTDSLIGVWSVLNVVDKYPFSKNEKALISDINSVIDANNMDPYILFKYGLYANSVAGDIKGLNKKEITEAYNNLVIQDKKQLDITSDDIIKMFNNNLGSYIKDIISDLIKEVLYRRVSNDKDSLINYINSNKDKYMS